jgi:hypothetical protein
MARAIFWGYTECWKFNQKLDVDVTNQTADREGTAKRLNGSGECVHFEKRQTTLLQFLLECLGKK